MDAFSNIYAFAAGLPAVLAMLMTGLGIFLTSDWRLSLTALLVQYVFMGVALTRFIRPEVAIVRTLVGVLAVFILYLTARRIQEMRESLVQQQNGRPFLGLRVRWGAGPLGLPLRLLVSILVILGMVLVFSRYQLVLVSADLTFVAFWLGAVGMLGLVLSSDPLRVAPAVLTVLTGFDLVYASLEPSLAVVGFFGSLVLLAAVAFSYLAIVQSLGPGPDSKEEDQP